MRAAGYRVLGRWDTLPQSAEWIPPMPAKYTSSHHDYGHGFKLFCLAFLRVATGFLLVWIGLNRIVTGSVPGLVRANVDLEGASADWLGIAIGAGQLLVGLCCAVGLLRVIVLPIQALMHGYTVLHVWWAVLDPYRWYIEDVDRIVFNSHVFYPVIITFAACVLLFAFRREDRWALDTLIFRKRAVTT